MGRSFNNKAEDAKKALEGGGGKPLPTGEYLAIISDVSDTVLKSQANAGKEALNLKLTITESGTGQGVGRKVNAWRVPLFDKWGSGKTAFEFFTFHKALGVDFSQDGEVDLPDNDEILGQEIGVYLTIGEPNEKGQSYNEVGRWFPASDGIKDTSADTPDSGNGDLDGDTSSDLVL